MKLKFLKAVFWAWMGSRGYYVWSKLMRMLLEWSYKRPITEYAHFGQLEAALGAMKWRSDPIKGRFDVISKPEKVEQLYYEASLHQRLPAEVGDCDEFACYAANCIENMGHRGRFSGDVYFMTVNWLDKDNEFHGHNICAFYDRSEQSWGHIGNWFNGKAQRGFNSLEELAAWWPKQAEGQMIGWALATPSLDFCRLEIG
jgi:hypothetical protein